MGKKKSAARLSPKKLLSRLSLVKEKTDHGTIFVPEQPIPLETPLDLAAATRLGMETILFFDWHNPADEPDIQFGRLALIPLDANTTVAWERTGSSLRLVAHLTPGAASRLWSHFVRDFFGNNGRGYNLVAFPSLPTQTTNYRPDLIPQSVIRAAYEIFLDEAVHGTEVLPWRNLDPRMSEISQQPENRDDFLDAYFGCCYEEESS